MAWFLCDMDLRHEKVKIPICDWLAEPICSKFQYIAPY